MLDPEAKPIYWTGRNHRKIPDSALRSTYDVSRLDDTSVFERHLNMTYDKQTDQWEKRKRILKALFAVKVRAFCKASKITRFRVSTGQDIKDKMRNILKPIIVEHRCGTDTNLIRHIDNMKLQQLWEACDLGDYEAIPEAMRRYLESRKDEILAVTEPPIEPLHSYLRPHVEPMPSSPPSSSSSPSSSRLESPIRCPEPIVLSTQSSSSFTSSPPPSTSKTQTKPNGPTSMRELLNNMMKPSSRGRRKRNDEAKPKAKRRRVERH